MLNVSWTQLDTNKSNLITEIVRVFLVLYIHFRNSVDLILTWASNEWCFILFMLMLSFVRNWRSFMTLSCGGFPIVYICLDTRNIFGSTIIKLALPYFVAHYAFGSVESGLKQCAVLTQRINNLQHLSEKMTVKP